jgi:hypothetical protein
VRAAAAAGVALLAVQFGEAELAATPAGTRAKILRRMKVAVNRLQAAVDLVVAARAAAVPAVPLRPRVPAARRATTGRAEVA